MLLNIIRWLAVIPAVWLASMFTLFSLLQIALAAERFIPRIGHIVRIMITVAAYFFYGGVLVSVGGWVAPSHKTVVVIILAIYSIIEAWRRCFIYSHFGKIAYWNCSSHVLGSFTAALIFSRGISA